MWEKLYHTHSFYSMYHVYEYWSIPLYFRIRLVHKGICSTPMHNLLNAQQLRIICSSLVSFVQPTRLLIAICSFYLLANSIRTHCALLHSEQQWHLWTNNNTYHVFARIPSTALKRNPLYHKFTHQNAPHYTLYF